jgi:hypothetical protein
MSDPLTTAAAPPAAVPSPAPADVPAPPAAAAAPATAAAAIADGAGAAGASASASTTVPAAAPVDAAAAPVCPVPLEALSSNFRKHADPKAPVPLRMMGAKGLVPMGPKEMATALFMLTFDADPAVRETAAKSAAGLPDKILSVSLRDETLEQPVIDYYAVVLAQKPEYLEMIVLNAGTADTTVARVATTAPERIAELISQNQLRLLRHDDIVRQLILNPVTKANTVDSICDFCVRSGLYLDDLPAFKAARRRVHGGAAADEEAAAAAAAKAAQRERDAEEMLIHLGANGERGGDFDAPPASKEEEKRRLTVNQQVMLLSVAKKIEWANKKGNKEVRTLLLRDPNKLVQMAVVHSPRITEEEITKLSLSRTLPMEVLMYIYNNRQLTKNYSIKVNLVNNPKVPVAVSMRFLSMLRASELKALSKNKNVPNAVANAARNLIEKKSQ